MSRAEPGLNRLRERAATDLVPFLLERQINLPVSESRAYAVPGSRYAGLST